MISDSCAICEKDGVFQVEDLPVGIRKFCSEKCFAQYTGLPVQKEGYYGMSKSPTDVPQQQNAENKGKNKINPIEKAEISGMASGATMEGLSALMGAEGESVNDLINEIIEDVFSEFDVVTGGFRGYGIDEWRKKWYEKLLKSKPVSGTGIFEMRDCYIEDSHIGKYFYIHKNQSSLTYTDEYEYGEWNYQPTEDTRRKVKAYQEKLRKKYGLPSIELGIDGYGLGDGDSNTPVLVMKVAVGKSEMAAEEDFEAHALILPLLLAGEEPPEKDDPLESWMEDYDAEESAYWFLKGEMQSRAPLTEMDLEQILEMLQNVPAREMNEAMEQADMMGDEAAMIVLIMANNKRKFREQFASEDVEEVSAYFANLKSKNPELARKIEFSVKNEDELPEKEIRDNGYDLDRIEEWVDLVGIEDENLQPYESCATCEGEGIIVTNYYPATRYDPPDIDYIPCEECIDGEYDPAYYMDKEGQYYAESFEADTNGDRQLEESIKRTKMSAIRTGLAITTFGIVLWNLWTNKKQETKLATSWVWYEIVELFSYEVG